MDLSGNPNATWVYHAASEAQALTLRQQLRGMMTYTSPRQVHETLMEILREDYAFLKGLFGPEATNKNKPTTTISPSSTVPQEQPPASQQPEIDESTGLPKNAKRSDAKIKVVKKGQGIQLEGAIDPPAASNPLALFPEPQPSPPPPSANAESAFDTSTMSPKEKKEYFAKVNKEAADKTLARLRAAGTDPKSLLTRENLTEWVERKGMPFTQISRDYVGLPDTVIAEAAKKFGLESQVVKNRRKAIMAQKNRVKA